MPSVYKATNVVVDQNKKVSIEVPVNMQNVAPPAETEPELLVSEGAAPEEIAEDIISKAKEMADSIIQTAKRDADSLLIDTKEQASKIFNESLAKAKAEGYDAGYNQGYGETEQMRIDAENLYQNTVEERKQILESIEGEVVQLILNILEKLVSNAISINPQIVVYLINKALSDSTQSEEILIRVSANDYENVLKHKDEIVNTTNTKIEIVTDNSLTEADCIIETPFGNIDCSLRPQLNTLTNDLVYLFENR